jgi:hypothetical protein
MGWSDHIHICTVEIFRAHDENKSEKKEKVNATTKNIETLEQCLMYTRVRPLECEWNHMNVFLCT